LLPEIILWTHTLTRRPERASPGSNAIFSIKQDVQLKGQSRGVCHNGRRDFETNGVAPLLEQPDYTKILRDAKA
jgi:hypothetical protein